MISSPRNTSVALILILAAIIVLRRQGIIDGEEALVVAGLLGSWLAAQLGAAAAVEFQRQKENAQLRRREAGRLNFFGVTLARQFEFVEGIGRQIVDQAPDREIRHLEIQQLLIPSPPSLDIRAIEPLSGHNEGAELAARLMRMDQQLRSLLLVIDRRNAMYQELALCTDNGGLLAGETVQLDEVRKMAGERVWHGLIGLTDHLVTQVEELRPASKQLLTDFSKYLGREYPELSILNYRFTE
jgi:hypothetical protein